MRSKNSRACGLSGGSTIAQHDVLVAGRRARQAAAAQAQPLTGARAGGQLHVDGAAERRHRDRFAERGFPGRDRQLHGHVAAVDA